MYVVCVCKMDVCVLCMYPCVYVFMYVYVYMVISLYVYYTCIFMLVMYVGLLNYIAFT